MGTKSTKSTHTETRSASHLQSNVRAHKHYIISGRDVRAQVGETLGRNFGIRLKRREDDNSAVMAPKDGAQRCILNAEKLQRMRKRIAAAAMAVRACRREQKNALK